MTALLPRALAADTTVLMATCGPSPLLECALRRLRRHTAPDLRVRLLHSGEAFDEVGRTAAAYGADVQQVATWALPHADALDAGLPLVETRWIVTLDSDAFPIADGWLDLLIGPMLDDASVGCVGPRLRSLRSVRAIPGRLNPHDYRAHVCALATSRAFLRDTGTTYALAGPPPHLGGLDTGEALTVAALSSGRRVVTPPWTAWHVFGTGAVIGGRIFHAFYASRRTLEGATFLDAQLREFFGIGLATLEAEQQRLIALEASFASGSGPDPFAPFVCEPSAPDVPLPWQALVD